MIIDNNRADDQAMQADQQHSPEFLKINPRGEVPALVDGDRTFSDSSSILVWLAGKYDDAGAAKGPSSYWSNDLYEQAQIVDWVSLPYCQHLRSITDIGFYQLSFANSWVQYGPYNKPLPKIVDLR